MTANAVVAGLMRVSHHYGSRAALDDITLDVPARRMTGVIGPDGVGKSTLLALISGVRKIQDGRVTVLGGDMADAAHRTRSYGRIAYMPQGLGRNLYPTLTVLENIDFFGRLFGQSKPERRAHIDELLQATGLDPFEDRPAGKLSGGMKQKLSLCCALIHDPDLLILDEPTTGVDPLSREQFWDLINSIRARRPQMSVIVSTAYMDEAERFDALVAMNDGKIIARGGLKDILQQAGETSLEAAFIALLPKEQRAQYQKVVLRRRPTHDDTVPAIEAEGLTRRFGNFVAVDHVSFRIATGEIFGFLGSNGSGKTTTMKMLTGLLPATEGWAKLFGRPMETDDMEMRRNVGYMSQSFSLYNELTVRQNLAFHAHIYQLPSDERDSRVQELLARFDLDKVDGERPEKLPLGMKQRLQLAVAILHRPAILILDEPTSGVDPVARDSFWRILIELSRDDGVTIFLSTHFMNEAERCDRISLMHAGKVLAVGTPDELVQQRRAASIEEAFVGYLADAAGIDRSKKAQAAPQPAAAPSAEPVHAIRQFDPGRLWACARRETLELLRDPIRIAFALLGPLVLMLAFGFGISFDVENLKYATFDQDQTPESRTLLENFAGSRYFTERPPIGSSDDMDRRFRSGELTFAIEIPSGFGRDLQSGRTPEVAVWIDGSMPFRAETARGYVTGVAAQFAEELMKRRYGPQATVSAVTFEPRFLYNQAFRSVFAMIPSVIMLMLLLIPAIMSAIAVVREKETGSIANFRSTPMTKFEFLVGKQLPYVAVAMGSFVLLVLMALFIFDVPVKGSFATLAVGSLLYVLAATGFGQLVSSFTRTQVAAVFATAILAIIPTVNFSGLLVPVSSLSGGARVTGLAFPAAWYQPVSVGTFTKSLGFYDLWLNVIVLAGFGLTYLVIAQLILRKQEA
ncbi:MAG: ribosome-associated ATPase/putative transporter RbbA [Xanthobacteraceae bacterium]|nr:ribosome-associated ATPase/putative transporter RbbA [Xanthobacteraceae bacterium]